MVVMYFSDFSKSLWETHKLARETNGLYTYSLFKDYSTA